jgi:hypothetical protein
MLLKLQRCQKRTCRTTAAPGRGMLRVAIGHDLRSAGRLLCRKWILKGNTPLTGRVPAPLCRPLQPAAEPSTPSMC